MANPETPPQGQLSHFFGQKASTVLFSSESTRRHKPRSSESIDSELKGSLDRIYRSFRDRLGYKRREMTVDFSEKHLGRVSTPDFDYTLRVALSDDGGEVLSTKEAVFRSPEKALGNEALLELLAEELDTVVIEMAKEIDLEELIDSIEERGTPGVRLDYAMDCAWCELTLDGVPATLRLEPRRVRLLRQPGSDVSLREMLTLLNKGL